MKGIFDILLGLWQIRLGAEIKALQAYLPTAAIATAIAAAGSAVSHTAFEQELSDGLRFGLRAKDGKTDLQEVTFEVGRGFHLRALTVRQHSGGQLDVRVRNQRADWTDDLWIVSYLEVRQRKASGESEQVIIELDVAPLGQEGEHLVFEHLGISRLDSSGEPLRKKPTDVNPISFSFSKCRLPL